MKNHLSPNTKVKYIFFKPKNEKPNQRKQITNALEFSASFGDALTSPPLALTINISLGHFVFHNNNGPSLSEDAIIVTVLTTAWSHK